MKFRCVVIAVVLFAAVKVTAQSFVLDGITVVKVSVNNPAGTIPISIQTFHSFPAFDYSEVDDSVSVDRSPVYVRCPVRTLQEGYLSVGDVRLHLMMIPGDTISIALSSSAKDSRVSFGGKTKDIQLYYLRKEKRFPVSIGQELLDEGSATTNLQEFKMKADKISQKERSFWKSSIYSSPADEKAATPELRLPSWFVRYETDAMRYDNARARVYAVSAMEFRSKGKIEIPNGYFDCIDSLPVSNDVAMYEKAYQFFLLHYINYKAARNGDPDHTNEFKFADELLSEKLSVFYKLCAIGGDLTYAPNRVIMELDKTHFPANSKYLADYLRKRALSSIKKLAAGDTAPNFYLQDRVDSIVSLTQFKGEVVYLSFWFAGCKPCIEEFPYENQLQKSFEGRPVKVVSICTRTSKSKWLEMIAAHKLNSVNLYADKERQGRLETNYVVTSYPHFVLIGKDGRIIQNYANRPRVVSKDIERALNH